MKTIVIYNQFSEGLKFFVSDEDLSRFHEQYINAYTKDAKKKKLQGELHDLIYGQNGILKVILLDEFPVQEVRDGARVIVCGFLS